MDPKAEATVTEDLTKANYMDAGNECAQARYLPQRLRARGPECCPLDTAGTWRDAEGIGTEYGTPVST